MKSKSTMMPNTDFMHTNTQLFPIWVPVFSTLYLMVVTLFRQ